MQIRFFQTAVYGPTLPLPLAGRQCRQGGLSLGSSIGDDTVEGLGVDRWSLTGGQGGHSRIGQFQNIDHILHVFFDQMRQPAIEGQHGERVALQDALAVELGRRDPNALRPDFEGKRIISTQGHAAQVGQRRLDNGPADELLSDKERT